jgi:hypothetical protein
MSISYVENGDSGLVARTLINQAIDGVNSGSLPYTGSAQITGSLIIDGTTTSPLGFTGSLLGDVTGNVTGDVTGNVNGNVKGNASTATTASYVLNAVSASYILQAVSSSFTSTASYVATAQTASYVITAQTASYVLQAISASFATTASFALNGGSTDTGSLLMTASVSSNVITFTKGNGTTFPITVDTGSGGGGGSTFPYTGSAIISGSLAVTGSLTLTNADISNGGIVYYDASSGVINQTDYVLDGLGKLTGGTRGTIDLSNLGTSGGCRGLILPSSAPGEPVAGSTYFEKSLNLLWIFNGSQWVSTELRP